MRIIDPYVEVAPYDAPAILRALERAIRTCYKSEDNIAGGSAERLIAQILKSGHVSTIEHQFLSLRFICDRGVTHELVRHRLVAFSQESTRYCNYYSSRFGREITVIRPCFFKDPDRMDLWRLAMEQAEVNYMALMNIKLAPQEARSVLPNSLKTEIVATANIREWRHILTLRCSPAAHPQMRQVMIPVLQFLKLNGLGILFNDIPFDEDFPKEDYAAVTWEKAA